MNMDIESQREFYNTHWANSQYQNGLKLARAVKILEGISKTKMNHPKIVDLGCGAGWLSGILGHFGPTVGIELSNTAIASAKIKYPYVKFESSDVFDWKFPAGETDIVVSQEVIEHVKDQAEYLNIASKILTKGGYLILTTPNADTLNHMPAEVVKKWTNQPIEDWLTMLDLKKLLNHQFEVIELSSFIMGYGKTGTYCMAGIKTFHRFFRLIGLGESYKRFLAKKGFGLHLYVLARKK